MEEEGEVDRVDLGGGETGGVAGKEGGKRERQREGEGRLYQPSSYLFND